ncbi:MAG: hypothetical protein EKK37_08075 [Sphingobacteriales bacterium]|nr:MAG: hypothetical protein EKK37_08075 [Sphingobacteriales bacterium]
MKFLIFIVLLSCVVNCYSQTQPLSPVKTITAGEYFQKSRQQKALAWVLLGTGVIVLGVGADIAISESIVSDVFGNGSSSSNGAILILGGLGVMAGSIPLFNAAARNKEKAMSLNINKQSFYVPSGSKFYQKAYPAVSLKISL